MSDQEQSSTEAAPSEKDLLKKRARLMGITFSNNITVESLRKKISEKMGEEDDTSGEEASEENQEEESEGQSEEVAEEATPVLAQETVQEPAQAAPAMSTQETLAALGLTPEILLAAKKIAATGVNPLSGEAAPVTEAAPTKKQKKMTIRQYMYNEYMKLIRVRIQNLNPQKGDLPGEIFTVANEYLGTVRVFVPYGEKTDDGWHIPNCIYLQLKDRKFLNVRTTKDRRSGHIQVNTDQWVKEFAIEVLPPLTQEEINRLAIAQAAAGSMDG